MGNKWNLTQRAKLNNRGVTTYMFMFACAIAYKKACSYQYGGFPQSATQHDGRIPDPTDENDTWRFFAFTQYLHHFLGENSTSNLTSGQYIFLGVWGGWMIPPSGQSCLHLDMVSSGISR